MARPLKAMVLACSAVTTGELTMALELLTRCERPMDIHAVVAPSLVSHAHWYGAAVHTYPAINAALALTKIRTAFDRIKPDVVVVADLNLMFGVSPEFGDALVHLLPHMLPRAQVVAMDLYDFDRTAPLIDIFGARWFGPAGPRAVPASVGRLLPSPSLKPARSAPGRGRYAMLNDHGPASAAQRAEVRRDLGISDDEALVIITSSNWQHRLTGHPPASLVATHFPTLMFHLLDEAAVQSRRVCVVHVGPVAFQPTGLSRTRYLHQHACPPEAFIRLLGASELYLSNNLPASTAVRAASLRVPVLTLFAGAAQPSTSESGVGQGLKDYVDATRGGFPFFMWPLGMFSALGEVLVGNSFLQTQRLCDVHAPEATVSELSVMLGGGAAADALRDGQERFFQALARDTDTPDVALEQALRAG